MRLCEEAARAHLLLEIARFARHAYRGKPSLPIEVPPLELGLIYTGQVGRGDVDAVAVYRKLDYALRGASQEAVSTFGRSIKRVRPFDSLGGFGRGMRFFRVLPGFSPVCVLFA